LVSDGFKRFFHEFTKSFDTTEARRLDDSRAVVIHFLGDVLVRKAIFEKQEELAAFFSQFPDVFAKGRYSIPVDQPFYGGSGLIRKVGQKLRGSHGMVHRCFIHRIFSDLVNTFIGKNFKKVGFQAAGAVKAPGGDVLDGGEEGVTVGAEAVFGRETEFAAALADEVFIPAVKLEFPGGPFSGAGLETGQDFSVFFHQQNIGLIAKVRSFSGEKNSPTLFPPYVVISIKSVSEK
jgi:hypothetical protein